jgi:hypothetical protein
LAKEALEDAKRYKFLNSFSKEEQNNSLNETTIIISNNTSLSNNHNHNKEEVASNNNDKTVNHNNNINITATSTPIASTTAAVDKTPTITPIEQTPKKTKNKKDGDKKGKCGCSIS